MRVLGFEPRTSALSELRSSQLSYTRDFRSRIKRKSQTFWVWLSTESIIGESYSRMIVWFTIRFAGMFTVISDPSLGNEMIRNRPQTSSRHSKPVPLSIRFLAAYPFISSVFFMESSRKNF